MKGQHERGPLLVCGQHERGPSLFASAREGSFIGVGQHDRGLFCAHSFTQSRDVSRESGFGRAWIAKFIKDPSRDEGRFFP